ncbi:wax ester/triacylglycerol synthase family O-acyltransferase [Nocardia brevicatena]|uniref:wax ester/triacylglycerol synthase family O-acyltransferase n=1 Tax=Nocardia brevicatena TaxID=37327 RepID=UPI000A04FD12|nr:wax ester/triacylglycerol synthase family O-acyltransferase [Nocardia brevicatena]
MNARQSDVVDTEKSKTVVKGDQLAPRDAIFVYDETDHHPSNIVAAYVFDATGTEPVDAEAAVGWIRARLGLAPLFQRRLRRIGPELDLPYWVPDPEFDIAEHVVLSPAGADWDTVRRRLSEIAAARMDLTRPPWQLHLFDRVRAVPGVSGQATVVVLKFHHSACDGVATRELELELFGGGHAPPAPVDTRWSARTATLRAAVLFPYRLARFATGLAHTRAAAAVVRERVEAGVLHEPLPTRPATRFNHATGPGLVVDQAILPLGDVMAVRDRCEERVTVNDVMLTVVSGALAAYLDEQGETPPESLAAMVPMSMRGVAQWGSANQLCQMSVDLHTGEADPRARLSAIRESVRRERQRNSDPAVLRCSARVETSPAWLLRLAGRARSHRSYTGVTSVPLNNTTISNVPPLGAGLSFRGAPLLRVFGVLPIFDGDGLRHLVSSQGDELVITFSVDPAMMPDTGRYRALLLRSFRELVAALG